MAGMAAGESKTKGGYLQPSTQPANRSQNNLARRVSFNESTFKQPHLHVGDMESQRARKAEHKRFKCCNYCCAWVSIVIGSIVLLILILGVIFFSVFQSNMPDFYVLSLDVRKLEVNSSGKDTFLNADVAVIINATNKNSKFELSYSPMKVETTLDDVLLGRIRLPGFNQKSGISTVLKARTVIKKEPVGEADGKRLSDDSGYREMVIKVDLGGTIHYQINGNKMAGFPFKVMCHDINQTQIDREEAAKCQVKLTPVS